ARCAPVPYTTLFRSIWGMFQVPVPAFVGRAAMASDARLGSEHAKSFFTGVLATALSTPCSAPFVGTAVGFALARGAFEIVAIFQIGRAHVSTPVTDQ